MSSSKKGSSSSKSQEHVLFSIDDNKNWSVRFDIWVTYGEIKALKNGLPPWSPKCLVAISQVLIAFQQMRIKIRDLGLVYKLWRNWATDTVFSSLLS